MTNELKEARKNNIITIAQDSAIGRIDKIQTFDGHRISGDPQAVCSAADNSIYVCADI